MNENILEIRGLTVELPASGDRTHAVCGLNLTIKNDEIVCLVGESGSGKSVTARSILGLLPSWVRPSGGQILLRGDDLLRASSARMREVRGCEISMIFQEPMTALNPLKTVGDQVDEAIAIHRGGPRQARLARVLEMFAAVHLPDPERIYCSYPHQLSGGQRQRAMIAMALALEPALLIADEPTTALDVTTQAQILALIKEVQAQRNMAVLFITHDFGVVADIADRVAVMQQGRLVECGAAREILTAPRHGYTRQLIEAIPSLVPPDREPLADAPDIVSIIDVSKGYGGTSWLKRGPKTLAVQGANLTIRRGETLGLVGESGSGKSTLARCIARLIDSDEGQILLGDVDLNALSRRQLKPYRKRVQMIFQDPYGSLNPRRTVGHLIAEGPMVHGMPEPEAMALSRQLLRLVHLDPQAVTRYPHEFSGGQRQRICIARALALAPEVLIADEAVSALDVSVQEQVLKLLSNIRAQLNLTMLFITHDLRVAAQVCDNIAVMRGGVILEQGPTARIFANPEHAYTRELLAAVPGKEFFANRVRCESTAGSTRRRIRAISFPSGAEPTPALKSA